MPFAPFVLASYFFGSFAQMLRRKVSVFRHGHDRRVAGELLDRTDVEAGDQLAAAECVAQIVPVEIADPGRLHRFLEPSPPIGLSIALRFRANKIRICAAFAELLDRFERFCICLDLAPAGFSVNLEIALVAMDVRPFQRELFAAAHAGEKRQVELGLALRARRPDRVA